VEASFLKPNFPNDSLSVLAASAASVCWSVFSSEVDTGNYGAITVTVHTTESFSHLKAFTSALSPNPNDGGPPYFDGQRHRRFYTFVLYGIVPLICPTCQMFSAGKASMHDPLLL